jgi:glycosyltransferase involved in cell wall biosynthesis
LHLGNFLPHKNYEMLVKAYSLLKRQQKIPHCLVLAGKNEKMRQKLETLIAEEKLKDDVILTGFVESEWLPALYVHADLFVYPSLYEGFGFQALEAMVHRTPVAISNVAALPEIAGDAAIQFDPTSVESMADTIYQALTDQSLRSSLIKKGAQRLKCFSWREMARKTVEIYQHVMRDA